MATTGIHETLLEQLQDAREQIAPNTDERDMFNAFFIGYLAAGLTHNAAGRRKWTAAVEAAVRHVEERRAEQDRKAKIAAANSELVDELAAAMTSSELVEEVARS